MSRMSRRPGEMRSGRCTRRTWRKCECQVVAIEAESANAWLHSSTGTSLAYEKKEKLEEIFDATTRFVLATSPPDGPLSAFASFRFDMEDTADSLEYEDEPLVDVLYM